MRRSFWAPIAVTGALVLSAGVARAQHPTAAPPPPPPLLMLQSAADDAGPAESFGEGVELLGFAGLHGGKLVKGAPFTATATSQSTRTLADGNHITRTTTTNLYRDSQGRFRKEVTLPAIGALAASEGPRSIVVISDPVAGEQYILEPDQKVAHKMPNFSRRLERGPGPFGKGGVHRGEWKDQAEANVQKESLGTQSINGVAAEGTRYTRTIPAGQIGNEKPIVVVSERWYSPDLQIVMMSKHSDPRFGDSSYSVSNVQRQEPAASLFTVPADYTVKEGGSFRRFRHGGPPPADAPAPPPAPGD